MQNTQSVQKFYEDVFEDFKNRLFIAYRFKSTISSEQIDKFSKIVKQKLHRKRQVFQVGIKLSLDKRNTSPKNDDNGLLNKVKVQHQQEEDYYRQAQLKSTIKQNQQQQDRESQESDDDDLKQFKFKKAEIPEVKVEAAEEKEEANGDNSDQQYEREDKMKEEILARSIKKISAHIIASYSTKNKKHIPKDQKTKIDLQNKKKSSMPNYSVTSSRHNIAILNCECTEKQQK